MEQPGYGISEVEYTHAMSLKVTRMKYSTFASITWENCWPHVAMIVLAKYGTLKAIFILCRPCLDIPMKYQGFVFSRIKLIRIINNSNGFLIPEGKIQSNWEFSSYCVR